MPCPVCICSRHPPCGAAVARGSSVDRTPPSSPQQAPPAPPPCASARQLGHPCHASASSTWPERHPAPPLPWPAAQAAGRALPAAPSAPGGERSGWQQPPPAARTWRRAPGRRRAAHRMQQLPLPAAPSAQHAARQSLPAALHAHPAGRAVTRCENECNALKSNASCFAAHTHSGCADLHPRWGNSQACLARLSTCIVVPGFSLR